MSWYVLSFTILCDTNIVFTVKCSTFNWMVRNYECGLWCGSVRGAMRTRRAVWAPWLLLTEEIRYGTNAIVATVCVVSLVKRNNSTGYNKLQIQRRHVVITECNRTLLRKWVSKKWLRDCGCTFNTQPFKLRSPNRLPNVGIIANPFYLL